MLENGKGEKKKKKKKQRNKEKQKTHIFAFFSKAYLFYFTFNSFFVLFEMYCLHSYLLLIILNQPFSLQFNKTKKRMTILCFELCINGLFLPIFHFFSMNEISIPVMLRSLLLSGTDLVTRQVCHETEPCSSTNKG